MPEFDVHERSENLFAPDSLLATQYFDRIRRRKDLTGEQRLMCAVIEQALDDYMKYAAGTDRARRALFADVEGWIDSADCSWLYSFETICDHLGLDGDYVRAGLRRWKARARGEGIASVSAFDTAAMPERRHASNE
jgi:hypothetical protein